MEQAPGNQASPVPMETCLFEGSEIKIPQALAEQKSVFQEIFSLDTWQQVLSESQKQQLIKLLPKFTHNRSQETQETIRSLFSGKNFKFGNPLQQFQERLKDGHYTPDISKYNVLCRKAKHKEYKDRQREYYVALLKEILVNREKILESVRQTSIDQPLKLDHQYHKEKPQEKCLDVRARKKYHKILKEVCEEVREDNSSEDEDTYTTSFRSRKQLFRTPFPEIPSETIQVSVQATFDPRPGTDGTISKSLRQTGALEVTEEDYLEMLHKHKKRKAESQDDPDLDTQSINLQDLIQRVQPSKKTIRTSGSIGMSKKKIKQEKKKTATDGDVEGEPASPPGDLNQELNFKDGALDAQELETNQPGQPPAVRMYGQHGSFFCIIRDLICEHPEYRFTTVKLEEQVRQWQESACSKTNTWYSQQVSWMDSVAGALKFLAGDALDTSIENFVPYLDYKERAQQWRWIGQGRDSDQELNSLCSHWLEHKDQGVIDSFDSGQNSPPPARMRTNFVVRPSSNEEKQGFRDQERQRFLNPHKAFTYHMHGYDSVVGPVKGVYTKDNAMNKAREHPLLINERPSYVTVLTLVRDAAARMPNGEGTRADICELLKDSQFLAPGVSDAQINNVVSGALDRLHYEKDPCVKYDVNKKIWIYLHRNRTQAEFERIHQAQGAAAKAKKALQKPKSTKSRVKDQPSSVSSANGPATVASMLSAASASTEPTPKPVPQPPPPVVSTLPQSPQTPESPVLAMRRPTSVESKTPATQPPVSMLLTQNITGGKPVKLQQTGIPKLLNTQVGQGHVKGAPLQMPDSQTGKSSAVVFLQPQIVRPSMAPQGVAAGKPLSVSLIQSLGATGVLQQKSGALLQEGGQQVMFTPTETGSLKLGSTPVHSSPQHVIVSSPRPSPAASPKTMPSPRAAAPSPRVSTPSPAPSPGPAVPVSTSSGKPVVTRILQQLSSQQQVVTIGNIGSTTTAGLQRQHSQDAILRLQAPGTKSVPVGQSLPIHRSLSVTEAKTVTSQSEAVMSPQAGTASMPSSPQIVHHTSRSILQQLSLGQGGKPATVMLGSAQGKAGTPGGATSVLSTQLIQSTGQAGAKPVVVGGKPIMIGGKPVILTGKPVAGGKMATVQLGGKPGQLGSRGVINIVSQTSESGMSGTNVETLSSSKPNTVSTTPSIVSQILQSGTTLVQRGQGQVMQGQGGKQPVTAQLMAGGQGSIILTQIPAGTKLKPGTPPVSQPRAVTLNQTGVLQGAQIIVQSSQAQPRVVTPHLLAGHRPTLLTTQGGKTSGIQYLKTVITQPGGKPSQATIVLSQAPTAQVTASTLQAAAGIKSSPTATGKQARTGPVYARVITPPSGVRLAAVKPGQGSSGVTFATAVQGIKQTEDMETGGEPTGEDSTH